MEADDIRKILDAEKKAEERQSNAAAAAVRILEEAEAEGQKIYDHLVRDAEAAAAEIRRTAAEAQRQSSKAAAEAAAQDCVTIKNDAAPRLDVAAALICERIVNS